jgi:hypothetical protein
MLVLGVLWLVIEINISKVPTREFDISIAPTSFKGKLSLNVGIYCFLLRKNIVLYTFVDKENKFHKFHNFPLPFV